MFRKSNSLMKQRAIQWPLRTMKRIQKVTTMLMIMENRLTVVGQPLVPRARYAATPARPSPSMGIGQVSNAAMEAIFAAVLG